MKRILFILILIIYTVPGCVEDDPHSSKVLELGFSVSELYEKGVTAEQLFNAGAGLEELLDAGVPLDELAAIDKICLHDIIMAGGDIIELKEVILNGDYSLDELLDQGLGIGFLKSVGFEEELINRNYIGTLKDIEGNIYNWVQINGQLWMTDDLKSKYYSDGTMIKQATTGHRDPNAIDSLSNYLDPCGMDRVVPEEYCDISGFCYTYKAATRQYYVPLNSKIQGICPDGWRLPTGNDAQNLLEYASLNFPESGLPIAFSAPYYWDNSGIDYFGLNIYPNPQYIFSWRSGFEYVDFGLLQYGNAIYWTCDPNSFMDANFASYRALYWLMHVNSVYISTTDKRDAICVRCIQDIE